MQRARQCPHLLYYADVSRQILEANRNLIGQAKSGEVHRLGQKTNNHVAFRNL